MIHPRLGIATGTDNPQLAKELDAWTNCLRPTSTLDLEPQPQPQEHDQMAIKLDDIPLPSGDFLSADEKDRMRTNQEAFFLTGGEPKVLNTNEPVKATGEQNFQTVFEVIIRDPATGEEQERLLGLGHSRKREALCIAAIQATDHIGPCYLDQLPPQKPGWSPIWVINGQKNPALAGNGGGAKGKGGDAVPWDD